jgi:hypothetical protein
MMIPAERQHGQAEVDRAREAALGAEGAHRRDGLCSLRVGGAVVLVVLCQLLDDLEVAERRRLPPHLPVGDIRDPCDEQDEQHDGVRGGDFLSQGEHDHDERSGREDGDVLARDVELGRCEDRAEGRARCR